MTRVNGDERTLNGGRMMVRQKLDKRRKKGKAQDGKTQDNKTQHGQWKKVQ
jgi:hypothetical protein